MTVALLNCCWAGDVALLQFLIEHHVDLNYVDQNGSVGTFALSFPSPPFDRCTNLLIFEGLIMHIKESSNPSKEFLEVLIKNGADMFALDGDGKTCTLHTFKIYLCLNLLLAHLYAL